MNNKARGGGRGGYDHGGHEEEEISTKEAGQTEGAGGGAATKILSRFGFAVQWLSRWPQWRLSGRGVGGVASRHLHTQEVDTRVVDISRTIDTKMVGITVIEAGVGRERGRGGRRRTRRQGGGWGRKREPELSSRRVLEQHFQHGGYQYNHSGFGQGRHYTS